MNTIINLSNGLASSITVLTTMNGEVADLFVGELGIVREVSL